MTDELDRGTNQGNDDYVGRLFEINESLKLELSIVVQQMETQLIKIHDSRRLKAVKEAVVAAELENKGKSISKGTKKTNQLRKEINDMWVQLEQDFKIDDIIKQEDQLEVLDKQRQDLTDRNTFQQKELHHRDKVLSKLQRDEHF